MKIDTKSRLLMIGDSITDCGRFGTADGLGEGYVRFVSAALRDEEIKVINKGVSGDTVRDLKARWQRDVLDLNPDWVSVMIGINDVWRQIDDWEQKENWILIDEYEQTIDALIGAVEPSLQGLVLMTPYVLELGRNDQMRAKMDLYGQVVLKIGEKYNAIFIDTQAAFDEFLQTVDSSTISNDRIHMNAVGHQVLSRAFLAAIE